MADKKDTTLRRSIRMKLPADLTEAIENMGAQSGRKIINEIEVLLKWAAWTYANGDRPEIEMLVRKGGYLCWNKKIRKRREVAELEKLFNTEGPADSEGARP